jgi:hypothetical protein
MQKVNFNSIPATVLALALLCGLPAAGAAQQPAAAASAPNQAVAAGSIRGQVKDVGGTPVAQAQVALTLEASAVQRLTTTDSQGGFSFSGVPPGRFTLTLTEPGLETFTLPGLLHPGEALEVPAIEMRIATATSTVEVSLPTVEIAQEQVRLEEKQRVLGIVPNFFVTYQAHPAPLNSRQKYSLALHGIVDPTAFAGDAIVAGVEQANNSLPGYGPGPSGYFKRFGAAFANGSSATLLRGAVFPSLLHQDPRFYYKADGTVWQKTRYALATAVICHGDNGRWQVNYSGILGDLSAGAMTNLYYPAGSRNGAGITFENGLLVTAGVGFGHVLQEFVFNHVTTRRH